MKTIEIIRNSANAKDRKSLWQQVFSEIDAKSICEVGVFKGLFAEHILHNCPGIERYYMVDPWRRLSDWNKPSNKDDPEFKEIFEEAMRRTDAFVSKRIVLRDSTLGQSCAIPDGSLDGVYLDGDHTLRGITIDLIHMMPKVRVGGIIGGDDFTKNIWQHGVKYSPTEVFPFAVYFAEAMRLPIVTLPHNQFCIVNEPQAGFRTIDLGGYTDLTPRQIYLPKRANRTGRPQ